MSSSKPLHDPPTRTWNLARRYLRFGTRSTDELRTYLRTNEVPQALIPVLVRRATAEGLLDDRACAALWATRLADQGYARQAIRQRLEAKGLAISLVSRVLAPRDVQDDDEHRAGEVVQRVLSLAALPSHALGIPQREIPKPKAEGRDPRRGIRGLRLRRRLARLLAQRGFDSDLIDRVLADSFDLISTD